jgi:hypothetical protein
MAVYQQLKSALGAAAAAPAAAAVIDALLQLELGRELERLQENVRRETPGNPAAVGFKAYSQADEDGILEALFAQLDVRRGTFVEIGCGNGLENNTHYLLLKGWRGAWIDGDASNIAFIRAALPASPRLLVVEARVDRDNAVSLVDAGWLREANGLDLLSVDIDGNDLEVARACAVAWQPQVIAVEYNAKFRPGALVQVGYEPQHRWAHDDYHGASLEALVRALEPYRLVSCNLAGTNAFFVRADSAARFAATEWQRLYQPARFHLAAMRSGHAPSLSFLREILQGGPAR